MTTGLPIWTIYDHPSDYPDCFVAHLFMNDQPTNYRLKHATLDGLRAMLPPELVCLARSPGDDPVIVECWL